MMACWEMALDNVSVHNHYIYIMAKSCAINVECFNCSGSFPLGIFCSPGTSRENGLGSGVSNIEKPKGVASVTTFVPN